MKKFTMFACLAFVMVFALNALAGDLPRVVRGDGMGYGGNLNFAKAGGDTISLMAATDDVRNNLNPGPCSLVEPYYDGDFEEGWNGWTHYDVTQPTVTHWNVSTYNQGGTGNHAAWAGDLAIVPCTETDAQGGYGNSWHDILRFSVPVGNQTQSSLVTVTATLQYDSEPGYDYTYLSYKFNGQAFGDLQSWDRTSGDYDDVPANQVAISGSVTYLPPEYVAGNQIAIYFRFKSDGAWSDEDCLFASHGGCQVDDINVRVENDGNIANYFEDFEHGGDPNNFGIWVTAFPDGVGDYAAIYSALEDADACASNYTAQVAFIDDGVVVPGTGGSQCVDWCYGPGGYIVTTTGGLAGEAEHINNPMVSPVMTWPTPKNCGTPDDDGIILEFGVYRHMLLTPDSPGIFYTWGVRSADTDGSAGDPQVITDQGWADRNFVYYGGPDYIRPLNNVTDLMNPGRDQVQVTLAVEEVGYVWGYVGDNGSPAPYFDNVKVMVFPYYGPGIAFRELDIAQDNWPARGTINYADLASHSVRFDSSNNISLASHQRNDPGDSMVVDITAVRSGSELTEVTLHYTLDRNPVFTAAMRTAGLPDVGTSAGMPAVGISGDWTPGKWAFDLPDTGFFFPGDVLHYYIEAKDAIGGLNEQASTLPADLTGYGVFGDPMGYNSSFVVHALPSIRPDGFGGFNHPGLLFINDFANRGGENEWYTALNNIGLLSGEDYDIYYVNGPSSGTGNGIGGRANDLLLTGYNDIMYTSGNLNSYTVSNGDFTADAGNDVAALSGWLDQGGKDIFMTGDGLASDMALSQGATLDFLELYLGVTVATTDVRPFIGNQTTPEVDVVPGNPVWLPSSTLNNWIAFGGCFGINTFDGVNLIGTGQRIATFNDPQGVGYSFSAATLNLGIGSAGTSRAISMPYDFMYVYTNPANAAQTTPARSQLLKDVLEYFGITGDGADITGVGNVPGIAFATSNYPNPFNPSTTIKYSMPKAGHLTLNVYNVRGQLVKTLIDGARPAGADQTIVWDGTDNLGSAVSSGVYFYEARTGGEVKVQKMALVK